MTDFHHKDLPVEEAARRYARTGAPDYSAEENAELVQWRESNPLHAEAYGAIEGVADGIEQLARHDRRLQELAEQAYEMGRSETGTAPQRQRLRWALPVAIAASVLMVFAGVRLASQFLDQATRSIAYENGTARMRSYTLEDGSVVNLDVATRIEVSMTRERRRIQLLSGRALFEVSHDAHRPFSVSAGHALTTALGTRFQIASRDGTVEVTLTEGSVVVAGTGQSWREQLSPGEQLEVPVDPASRVRRAVDPFVITSWSRGRLVFRATPLGEALDEVNRYAAKKLHLGDPALSTLTVSGNFVAGNGELAASAFAAVLPVHPVDAGSEIILFPGRADAPR
jgi:transmembrane sensor